MIYLEVKNYRAWTYELAINEELNSELIYYPINLTFALESYYEISLGAGNIIIKNPSDFTEALVKIWIIHMSKAKAKNDQEKVLHEVFSFKLSTKSLINLLKFTDADLSSDQIAALSQNVENLVILDKEKAKQNVLIFLENYEHRLNAELQSVIQSAKEKLARDVGYNQFIQTVFEHEVRVVFLKPPINAVGAIKDIFDFLKNQSLIQCSYKEYEALFGSKNPKKIIWYGSLAALNRFVVWMPKWLKPSKHFVAAANCFLLWNSKTENASPINSNQLRNNKSPSKREMALVDRMGKLMNQISEGYTPLKK